jgi:hypothetical protein
MLYCFGKVAVGAVFGIERGLFWMNAKYVHIRDAYYITISHKYSGHNIFHSMPQGSIGPLN